MNLIMMMTNSMMMNSMIVNLTMNKIFIIMNLMIIFNFLFKIISTSPFSPLSHMAKDYFSIQATSVSSEQMFSIAKHTLNPIQNRLDSEKAQESLCLKSWIESEIVLI